MTADASPMEKDLTRFQARVLDAVNVAIIAARLDGEIVYWNRSAVELYGWEADEAVSSGKIWRLSSVAWCMPFTMWEVLPRWR
jgi:PAS domain-containing protein